MIATSPAVDRLVIVVALAACAAGVEHEVASRPRYASLAMLPDPAAPRVDATYAPVPATIVVLSAGAEPRAVMRYRPRRGGTTRFQLTVHGRSPELVVTGATEISRVDDDGAFALRSVVHRMAPSRTGDRLDEDVDLAGLVVDTVVEATGAVRSIAIDAQRPARRSLVERVAFALSSLEQFPDAAIGAGARWQTTAIAPRGAAGPAIARTRTTTLAALRGPLVELRSAIVDSAGPHDGAQDGAALHLVALAARGDDQRQVALDTLEGTQAAWLTGTRTTTADGNPRSEAFDDLVDLARRRGPIARP